MKKLLVDDEENTTKEKESKWRLEKFNSIKITKNMVDNNLPKRRPEAAREL